MEDNSSSVETNVELELHEEIVGNLNYTTPVTERSSRFNSNSEDRITRTTFKEPIITNTSKSTMTSASAAIVDPVTWHDPRSSCSLAGNYQVPWPLAQRSDGMSFATRLVWHFEKIDVECKRFFTSLRPFRYAVRKNA